MRRPLFNFALAFALSLGSPAALRAQAGASPQLASVLDHAAAQAGDLLQSLPSFTCNVTGHTDVSHNGKPESSTSFQGTIRAQRSPRDGNIVETTTFTNVDGKPFVETKHHPYFVHGGFTEVLTYVAGPRQACSDFRLQGHRVDFAAKEPPVPGCEEWRGLHGFFTVDDAGNITHIERTLPARDTMDLIVPFAAVDLAAVDLKGTTYRLAAHIVSDNVEEDITRHFDATYSGCKLFTTEIKILPGKPVDDNGTPLPPPDRTVPPPVPLP